MRGHSQRHFCGGFAPVAGTGQLIVKRAKTAQGHRVFEPGKSFFIAGAKIFFRDESMHCDFVAVKSRAHQRKYSRSASHTRTLKPCTSSRRCHACLRVSNEGSSGRFGERGADCFFWASNRLR
jgi:hypothetical protein